MADDPAPLRIGYVPEHYLLPLHLCIFPFAVELVPFPSGTGHMITSLRADLLDLAIGLTEGWVAGLLSRQDREAEEKGYRVVGRWVQSPLRWAVVTGRDRDEISSMADLQRNARRRVGVSRLGSGSHIMAFVLAQQENWLSSSPPAAPQPSPTRVESEALDIVPLGPLADLISGVTGQQAMGESEGEGKPRADFFMWEHFTTKPHFSAADSPLKKIGEIYSPWPSWHIAASTKTFPDLPSPQQQQNHGGRLSQVFEALDQGIQRFHNDPESSIRMLGTGQIGCRYNDEDGQEWLKTASFVRQTKGVDRSVMDKVVDVLQGTGVVKQGTRITAGDGVVGVGTDERG